MTGAPADADNPVLAAIRTRRVVRSMGDRRVSRADLETVLDAGRWAPSAGNRHLQRFVATDHPGTLRVLRMVSPGMIARPAAVIVICTDWALAPSLWLKVLARAMITTPIAIASISIPLPMLRN